MLKDLFWLDKAIFNFVKSPEGFFLTMFLGKTVVDVICGSNKKKVVKK